MPWQANTISWYDAISAIGGSVSIDCLLLRVAAHCGRDVHQLERGRRSRCLACGSTLRPLPDDHGRRL